MTDSYKFITADSVLEWDESCDVIVVGLGCAGGCAAVEAAEAGVEVIGIEQAVQVGGTTALSGSMIYLGGGTPMQTKHGFEDSVENMYNYLSRSSGPRPDLERIEMYCNESVSHYKWLCDRDIPFGTDYFPGGYERVADDGLTWSGNERSHPFNQYAHPIPRAHIVQAQGEMLGGAVLVQKLVAAAEAAGTRVLTQTSAQNLVLDGVGAVVGVCCLQDDRKVYIQARGGVVLTAGGFIHNREMLEKYAPLLATSKVQIGCEGDTGSGIQMALSIGAAAIRMDAGSVSLPVYPPLSLKKGILVNQQGQRFINEDSYMGRVGEFALYYQQGRAYMLLDDEHFAMPEIWDSEVLVSSDSISEIENHCGFPIGALAQSLDYYNQHAAKKADPLFHKGADYLVPLLKAPYHLLDVSIDRMTYFTFTLGGLHTLPTGEVLDPQGKSICGLYAAGRTVSGITKLGYSSGTSLGDGTFFGRKAGKSAANNN